MFKKILLTTAIVAVSNLSPIYATDKCPDIEKKLEEIIQQNKEAHSLLSLVLERMRAEASMKR